MAAFSTGMFGARPQGDPNDPAAVLAALGIQPQQGMGTFLPPRQPAMNAAPIPSLMAGAQAPAPVAGPMPGASAFDPSGSPAGPTPLSGLQDVGAPVIAAPKPSFFGQGGVGRGIAGTIGDYLLQASHMQPVFAPAMQQQRAVALQQRQRQQALQDSRDTWLMEQQYKLAHPDPLKNDTVNDYNFIKQTLGEDKANQYLDTKTQGTPFVYDQYNPATGQTEKVITNRSAVSAGPSYSSVPDAAVQYLRQNPHFAQDFDAKYGQGSSAKYLGNGGAGPQTPQTFR